MKAVESAKRASPGLVLYCECARGSLFPEETQRAVKCLLRASGWPVVSVEDLCGAAATRDARLAQIAQADSAVVIACYPRAIRWLFHWAGHPLDERRVRFLNLREMSADAVAAALEPAGADAGSVPAPDAPAPSARAADWRPWFPVIDYARCTGCGQCKEFCLFGVYAEGDDGRIKVRTPEACKDNCPACARMCPEVAIMFPKIEERSPISGALDDPAAAQGKVRLSREQLFGAGALDRLRARQRPPLLK